MRERTRFLVEHLQREDEILLQKPEVSVNDVVSLLRQKVFRVLFADMQLASGPEDDRLRENIQATGLDIRQLLKDFFRFQENIVVLRQLKKAFGDKKYGAVACAVRRLGVSRARIYQYLHEFGFTTDDILNAPNADELVKRSRPMLVRLQTTIDRLKAAGAI